MAILILDLAIASLLLVAGRAPLSDAKPSWSLVFVILNAEFLKFFVRKSIYFLINL